MKSLALSIISFLLVFNVFAQVDSYKNILGFTPYFSSLSNAQKLPIEPTLSNENFYVNGKYEKPLQVNYTGFYANLEICEKFKNNFYFVSNFQFGQDNYKGTLNYSKGSQANSPIDSFAVEEIYGMNIGVGFGIGKAYYVTKSKKLMLMPKAQFYYHGIIRDLNLYNSGNRYSYSDTYSTMNQGLRLGLNVNYFFSKHFGVGLSFNQVVKLETTSNYKLSQKQEQRETGLVLNLNQLPQVRFLYTFNFRKGEK
jgi:hypothetical protein